ncbi:hypothetical protein Tco_0803024 [Tanacetum coccineum]|uniref:Uncharacterized protein n=1 Tax=Tanacetum coccineum TaxID=301880 RepID=A0ABQ5A2X7_9ASTR
MTILKKQAQATSQRSLHKDARQKINYYIKKTQDQDKKLQRLMIKSFKVSPTPYVPPSKKDYEILFQLLFDEYFNPPPRVVSPDPVAVAAPRVEIQSQVTHQGVEEQIHVHQNAQFDNAPLLHNLSSDPSSEETTLQGVIPQNLHHLNQSFDTLTKLTKNHPLENVIGDPSRPVSTRSQLQEHATWCYFDANVNPIPFGGKQSG